jgi:serine/threonine protein kinase
VSQPNIIRLISFKHNIFPPHIVLEFMDGKTLREENQKSRLSLLELKSVAKQSLDAVSHLHEKGITHRDLKPDNVTVMREPMRIKIIDFNVASQAKEMTATTGTSWYIAPEVGRGKYCSKVDVWSLGVMLMEVFCGLPPLQRDRHPDGFNSHLFLNGKKDSILVGCIFNMLTPDPKSRPSSKDLFDYYGELFDQHDEAEESLPSLADAEEELPDTAPPDIEPSNLDTAKPTLKRVFHTKEKTVVVSIKGAPAYQKGSSTHRGSCRRPRPFYPAQSHRLNTTNSVGKRKRQPPPNHPSEAWIKWAR